MGRENFNETNLIDSLNWRYAVKKYNADKKISDADLETLKQVINLAPSSMGLQPFKTFIITDQTVRRDLQAAGYGQSQFADASHILVFAYKNTLTEQDADKYIDRIAEVRGIERSVVADFEAAVKGAAKRAVDGGYVDVWNSRQAYIAVGFLIEAAALLGIDATPMEGIDVEKFNEILGLEDHSAVVAVALGYRDEENDWLAPLKKVRKPNEEMFVHI